MSALLPGLLPGRRRAEAFSDALDAMLDDTRERGRGAGASSAPDLSLERLLDIASDLRTTSERTPAARPDASFTAGLRERLMAAADTELVATDAKLILPAADRRRTGRRQGRVTAAVAALAVVAGTAGVAVAASGSVPGQSLYPFKRGVEQAQSAFSFSEAARGKDKLGQADARLDEVSKMLQGTGDRTQLAETVDAFTDQAGQGSDLLLGDFQANGDTSSVDAVRDFAGTAMGRLTDLAPEAPPSLRPALAQAAQLVADVDQQARVLCAQCGARDALSAPTDLRLTSVGIDQLLTLKRSVAAVQQAAGSSAGDRAPGTKQQAPAQGAPAAKPPQVDLPHLGHALDSGAGGNQSGTGAGGGSGTGSATGPAGGLLGTITKGGGSGSGSGSGGGLVGGLGGTVGGAGGTVDGVVSGVDKTLGGLLGTLGGPASPSSGGTGKDKSKGR